MDDATTMRHERTSEHQRNVANYHSWHPPSDPTKREGTSKDPVLTLEALKLREQQVYVDHVQHIVPWWVQNVQAAENGQEIRMEDFLDDLTKNNPWCQDEGIWDNGWGVVPDVVNGNDWARDDDWENTRNTGPAGKTWAAKPVDDWDMSGTISSLHARRTPTASSTGSRKRRRIRKLEGQIAVKLEVKPDHLKSDFVDKLLGTNLHAGRKRRMLVFSEVCLEHMLEYHFELMASFTIKMPTEEKVQKIEEVLRQLSQL